MGKLASLTLKLGCLQESDLWSLLVVQNPCTNIKFKKVSYIRF